MVTASWNNGNTLTTVTTRTSGTGDYQFCEAFGSGTEVTITTPKQEAPQSVTMMGDDVSGLNLTVAYN